MREEYPIQQPRLERARNDRIDPHGRELLDPTPVAPPIGYIKQESLSDQIRRMVTSEMLAREAAAAGMETFEEADDFDVGDDYDPSSPFEEAFHGQFDLPTEPEPGQGAKPAEGGAVGGLDAAEAHQAPAAPSTPVEGAASAASAPKK